MPNWTTMTPTKNTNNTINKSSNILGGLSPPTIHGQSSVHKNSTGISANDNTPNA